MNICYKISIDRVNANYISGWCYHRFHPTVPVELECYQNDRLRATAEASIFREDLVSLGVHPTGKCGFEFIAEVEGGFDFSQAFVIRPKGKSTVLADLSRATRSGPARGKSGSILRLPRKKLPRTAIFMHIPKTAGTSFNTLAQAAFPKGTAINHIELLSESEYNTLADNYNYISGHLRFGRLRQYFSSDHTDYYAILRQPYAQLQSHLKWLIQTAANPEERYFKVTNPVIYNLGKKLDRVDFSEKQSLKELVENLDALEAAFIDNLQTRYFLDRQPERVSADDLTAAMAHSRFFRLLGVTEKYDSFVRSFSELNELACATPDSRLNISSSAPLFDPGDEEVLKILQPLVHADLQLYDSIAGKITR